MTDTAGHIGALLAAIDALLLVNQGLLNSFKLPLAASNSADVGAVDAEPRCDS